MQQAFLPSMILLLVYSSPHFFSSSSSACAPPLLLWKQQERSHILSSCLPACLHALLFRFLYSSSLPILLLFSLRQIFPFSWELGILASTGRRKEGAKHTSSLLKETENFHAKCVDNAMCCHNNDERMKERKRLIVIVNERTQQNVSCSFLYRLVDPPLSPSLIS